MLRQSATPYQIRFEANDSPSGDALSNGKCVQQVGEAILHEPVYEKPPVVVYRREHEHSESENKSQSHQLFAAESKIALHKKNSSVLGVNVTFPTRHSNKFYVTPSLSPVPSLSSEILTFWTTFNFSFPTLI